MITFASVLIPIIFAITLLLIIFERTHKTLAAMFGAGLSLLLAISPGSGIDGEAIIPDYTTLLEIVEIDLLLIIIGITLMVATARNTGIFDYIAIIILKKSGSNPYTLLIALSLLTMIFSAFLDAYMAILLVGSITLVGCEALEINPKPYILAEAIFGDLGGTMTRIASPPNLIIGGHFDIDFITFLLLTAPFVLIASVITLLLWVLIFRKEFNKGISQSNYKEILLIDENAVIRDPRGFKIAAIVLILTIIGFAISSFLPLHLELGYIAMAGGFLMVGLVREDIEHALEKVEWPIVFFLIGLLVIVGIAEKLELLELIATPIEVLLNINQLGGILGLAWINAAASSVLDNVPVASIMTSIMDSIIKHNPDISLHTLLVAVVIGTNLGGNITPIGSASTVQALTILKRSEKPEERVSFLEFMKLGSFVSFFQLVFGSFYIIIFWLFKM